ncbi:hypothetical protein B0O99DRAFT_617723 [Bisporella sp. PMI_857]|nr:hypothetical protein B0O99DRAFT_617723 [Bisporella sp. PMI_857]
MAGHQTSDAPLCDSRSDSRGYAQPVDRQNITPRVSHPALYRTIEQHMEEKAKAQGGLSKRKEFFKYLQKMRDFANQEHAACSSSYRAWLADSMTWERFFKEEPFPARNEPTSQHKCVQSHGSSSAKVDQISIPPDLMADLRKANATGKYPQHHRILIIGSFQTSYEESEVRKVYESFSSIEPASKSIVSKALGCQFHVQIMFGNVIFWCSPSKIGDTVATNLGLRFLVDWERKGYPERTAGRHIDVLEILKEFDDPACTEESISHYLIINKKASTFSKSIFQGICDAFSKDIAGRSLVEKLMSCSFSLITPKYQCIIRTLKVTPSSLLSSVEDEAMVTRAGYNFLEAWVERVYHTLVHDNMRTVSLSEFHQQYKERIDNCGISVHGAYQQNFVCSESELKNISHIILIDNEKDDVEKAVQCKFIMQGHSINKLSITIIPHEGLHHAIFSKATDIFLEWMKLAMTKPIKLSRFWEDWAQMNLKPEAQQQRLAFVQILADQGGHCVELIPSSMPDQEWDKYVSTFGSSELDRVIIEEQAKAEGLLRMVYDQETREVITLGEFRMRIQARDRLLLLPPAEGQDMKRKAHADRLEEGETGSHAIKKVCS